MLAGRVWRDDGLDAALAQLVSQALCIIGAIGKKSLRLMPHRQQAARPFEVVDIPGGDRQRTRTADFIGQGVDLGRLPAARAAGGVVERPLLHLRRSDGL